MSEILSIQVGRILPEGALVKRALGLPAEAPAGDRVERMLTEAAALFTELTVGKAILRETTIDQFDSVYRGEGDNDSETPLEAIFPRASQLALFATTLGEAISRKIGELFDRRDFALASILDAYASEGADAAAGIVQEAFGDSLDRDGRLTGTSRLLRYSPGYCGWHVSGQKALFAALDPSRVGIRLTESCLMQPLKSISGVIVAGPGEIHDFDDSYRFCADCETHGCRERIRQLKDA